MKTVRVLSGEINERIIEDEVQTNEEGFIPVDSSPLPAKKEQVDKFNFNAF